MWIAYNRKRWRWIGALLGLTSLGMILRFYRIGANSYWLDEAISVLIARASVPAILSNAGRSSHPSLYYLLLHFWLRWGTTAELWVRLPSALLGSLTIPLIALLGQDLFNRRVGLVSGLFLTLAPFHVAYSQEARMYAQVVFLGVAGLLCFYRAINERSYAWWLATLTVMALAMMTHLFAIFLLAAMSLYVLCYHREQRILICMFLVNLVAVVVVVPHLVGLLSDSQQASGGLRPLVSQDRPSLFFPITAAHILLMGYSIPPLWMPIALFISLAVLGITLMEVRRALRLRVDSSQSLVLLLLVGGLVLLVPFVGALIQPAFLPERTLLVGLPALLLLIAWGIAGTRRRTPLLYLGIGLVALLLFSLKGYYFDNRFQKPPMREVAALVEARFSPGDGVLHTSDGSYLPSLVYSHPDESYLLAGDPDPRKATAVYELWGGEVVERDDLPPEFERLWVAVALEHSVDFQRDALEWFESQYDLLYQHSIDGIGVYLFDLDDISSE